LIRTLIFEGIYQAKIPKISGSNSNFIKHKPHSPVHTHIHTEIFPAHVALHTHSHIHRRSGAIWGSVDFISKYRPEELEIKPPTFRLVGHPLSPEPQLSFKYSYYTKDEEHEIHLHQCFYEELSIKRNRKLKFSVFCYFFLLPSISVERLAEDLNPSVPKMPSESASEVSAPKVISYCCACTFVTMNPFTHV